MPGCGSLRDGYVGIAPVPGGRVNVGIVLGPSWRAALARGRRRGRVAGRSSPPSRRRATTRSRGASADRCDADRRAPRRSASASRGEPARAGSWSATRPGSSTRSPARASTGRSCRPSSRRAAIRPRSTARRGAGAPSAAYDRAMRRRFAAKDAVSWLVQAFLGPAGAVRIRRATARRAARRPCDDGPRDGRPRPRRRAASIRASSPRCSRHDASEPGRRPRSASPPTRVVPRRRRPDPAVPHRAVGRRRRPLDAAGRRPRVRRVAGGGRRSASSTEETGYVGEVEGLLDVSDRLFDDVDGGDRLHAIRILYRGADRRRRAARRARRLDRHVPLVDHRRRRRRCVSASSPARPLDRLGADARAGPALTDAQRDRHRHRRPAGARLRARPRRRALGRRCCPTTPGRAAVERRADGCARRRLRRPPAAHRRPRAGLPVAWRSRTWTSRRRGACASSTSPARRAGMDVTWRIEPGRRRRLPRSTIEHDFRAARARASPPFVDRWFTRPIAGRTLATFKALAEAVAVRTGRRRRTHAT